MGMEVEDRRGRGRPRKHFQVHLMWDATRGCLKPPEFFHQEVSKVLAEIMRGHTPQMQILDGVNTKCWKCEEVKPVLFSGLTTAPPGLMTGHWICSGCREKYGTIEVTEWWEQQPEISGVTWEQMLDRAKVANPPPEDVVASYLGSQDTWRISENRKDKARHRYPMREK